MDGIREYNPKTPDLEIIQDAYTLFEEDRDFESLSRSDMIDDISFENGDVWGDMKRKREIEGRPALNIARLNQFLNHVKNGMRQSKPSIKVSARGSNSIEEESKRVKAANHRQGLIRYLQNKSDAADAYQDAFDQAVGPGRGFVVVRTKYVSDKTFDQEITINAVPDGLDVFMDRTRTKKDYSDSNHGFILNAIKKDVFKSKYPKADPSHWRSDSDGKWIGSDDITIAEFYCIWTKRRELWETEDGLKGYMDELDDVSEEAKEEIKSQIKRKRKVLAPYVMWYKMTSLEILDKKPVMGSWIPIVPMVGYEKKVNGIVYIKGLTRDLKDICKMYNYCASQEAERLSLSPKIPYMVAEGQIPPKYAKDWANINNSNSPYITYKAISSNGVPVGAPQRQQPIPIDAGLVNAKISYIEDMKAVSGIDNPSLGMMGPERSGIALKELKRGSDIANMHFVDNARICITHVGRIVNDWLPLVYDTNRIVKILGDEDEEKEIELGGMDKDQEEITLGDEEYDIVVTMGANYNTRRQESLDFMMQLIQSAPQITPLIYDLLVKNMDSPGAQQIAERLKKTIPPEILDEQGGEKQLAGQLQQATQELQQSGQAIQMLTQQLEMVQKELEDRNIDMAKDIKLANIAQMGKVAVARINSQSKQMSDSNQRRFDYFKVFRDSQQSTQPGVRIHE